MDAPTARQRKLHAKRMHIIHDQQSAGPHANQPIGQIISESVWFGGGGQILEFLTISRSIFFLQFSLFFIALLVFIT